MDRFVKTTECMKLYEILEKEGVLDEESERRHAQESHEAENAQEVRQSRSRRSRNVDAANPPMLPNFARKLSNSNTNSNIAPTNVNTGLNDMDARSEIAHIRAANSASGTASIGLEHMGLIMGRGSVEKEKGSGGSGGSGFPNIVPNSEAAKAFGRVPIVSSPATKLYEKGKLRKPKPRPASLDSRSNDIIKETAESDAVETADSVNTADSADGGQVGITVDLVEAAADAAGVE